MCSYKQQDINTTNIQSDQIDSIFITYRCGMVDSSVAIRCERLAEIQEQHPKNDYSYVIPEELLDAYIEDNTVLNGIVLEQVPVELIDTFIVDNSVLNKIKELLNSKILLPDFSEDARMFVTIKNKNNTKDYICIGQQAAPIKYNGKSCSMDRELVFLLRYYSGYYLWFDDSALYYLEELQDTVFYQKALEQVKRVSR
jgi:hypothetical protein